MLLRLLSEDLLMVLVLTKSLSVCSCGHMIRIACHYAPHGCTGTPSIMNKFTLPLMCAHLGLDTVCCWHALSRPAPHLLAFRTTSSDLHAQSGTQQEGSSQGDFVRV